jgi:hypothetical protein
MHYNISIRITNADEQGVSGYVLYFVILNYLVPEFFRD